MLFPARGIILIQGGLGKTYYHKVEGPIPMIMNAGVDYYAQFKITGDSGSGIPPALRGFQDRVFGIGPEFNIFFPKPRLTLVAPTNLNLPRAYGRKARPLSSASCGWRSCW